MKIAPTLEGGLRIDAEGGGDWLLLEALIGDAMARRDRLAERLGKRIADPDVAADWKEFVVPDLDSDFQADIASVALAIEKAKGKSGGLAGPLRITRSHGTTWYSVLNQARLALEDLHQFGTGGDVDPAALDPDSRSAFFRSQFYCALQSLLLDHVM